jgi:predicted GIY-YIG superfamily endonuclease
MSILEMKGPFELKNEVIDEKVQKNMIGNYALGFAGGNGVMSVNYVGRSDTDLNRRLKDHTSEGYTHFMYSYALSIEIAYIKECHDYHAFVDKHFRLDNENHPAKPENINSQCPYCGQ